MRAKQQPKLFHQLLDDYFNALVSKEMPSDTAVPRQTVIDETRLCLINEYELFAGRGAATNGETRTKVANYYDDMRRKLSELTCPKSVPVTGSDPIHEHVDGSFWVFDETWTDEFGPFKSRAAAEKECEAYAGELLGPQCSDLPKRAR